MPYANSEDRREAARARYWTKKGLPVPPKREKADMSWREKTRTWLRAYKQTLSCADCGFSFAEYPEVCDFHHRDPDSKGYDREHGIGRLARYGATKRLREEIAKCDPLCANCHRIRHAKERS